MRDFDSERAFQPYLLPGEGIRWSGRPKQGIAFSARDIFLIPFSLLWSGFSIRWSLLIWCAPFRGDSASRVLYLMLGSVFVVVGLFLVAGRFLYDAWVRSGLHYAISHRRVLLLNRGQFAAYDIDRLPRLKLTEHRDGTGTIAFDRLRMFGTKNNMELWVPSIDWIGQFFRIDHPRDVYRLIREPRA